MMVATYRTVLRLSLGVPPTVDQQVGVEAVQVVGVEGLELDATDGRNDVEPEVALVACPCTRLELHPGGRQPFVAEAQGELAEKVATDARQVSRYENGRITPSLDVVVRIAEVLDVSIDYLVVEGVGRRPLHAPDHGLGERLAASGTTRTAVRCSTSSTPSSPRAGSRPWPGESPGYEPSQGDGSTVS